MVTFNYSELPLHIDYNESVFKFCFHTTNIYNFNPSKKESIETNVNFIKVEVMNPKYVNKIDKNGYKWLPLIYIFRKIN